MNASEKYIIGIHDFINNYVLANGKEYDGIYKLTHKELGIYLSEKGYSTPDRISFRKVKNSDILMGEILLVKDETGQVIAYRNPKLKNLDLLLKELKSKENKKNMLKRRREILKESGYIETRRGDIVEERLIDEKEETITHKINRNKKLVNRDARGMKGMVGLE